MTHKTWWQRQQRVNLKPKVFMCLLFPVFLVLWFLPPPPGGARSQTRAVWRTSFRDTFTTETSVLGDQLGGCLEKATSWRREQESSPPDTMQNWTNYWTVRVHTKYLQRLSLYSARFVLELKTALIWRRDPPLLSSVCRSVSGVSFCARWDLPLGSQISTK